MPDYEIVRFYQDPNHPEAIVKTGLTLEAAQKHCRDPETSSSTCSNAAGLARTKARGPWFDGYREATPSSGRRRLSAWTRAAAVFVATRKG